MDAINNRLLAELSVKDDLAFKFGDTLDVKASIGMVVITFLGTQTAYYFDKHVTGFSHILQLCSVAALVVAAVFSILELWPRKYLMVEPEQNTASRIVELKNHYSQYEDEIGPDVLSQLTENEIKWTLERIAANQSQNSRKARYLDWAYKATAAAFTLNAVTLVIVGLTHPF